MRTPYLHTHTHALFFLSVVTLLLFISLWPNTISGSLAAVSYNGTTYVESNGGAYQASTTTVVVSSLNPSVFGQAVTFTATVSAAPNPAVPTGTVVFTVDGNPSPPVALNSSGQATFTSSSLSLGNHTVAATYTSNSASFNGSASAPLTQSVTQASTTTTVASSANPSVFGQAVTFTATVSGAPSPVIPTGALVFTIDGNQLAAVTLNGSGQASFATSSLSVGAHTVTAAYTSNSPIFSSSAGSLANGQMVNRAGTTTTIRSDNPDPSIVGQNVVITYLVEGMSPGGADPTGTVTVSDGVNSCSGTVIAGMCSMALTTPGPRTLTATYAGDSNFSGSSDTEVHNVIQPPVISMQFAASNILLDQMTSLIISILNPNTAMQLTGVGFNNPLPVGLIVATPNGLSNSCGGTLPAIPGSRSVNLSNVTLPAGTTCQIMVDVKGTTSGHKTNLTSNITSTEAGNGARAMASINVHEWSMNLTGPAVCLGPGAMVAALASVTNNSDAPIDVAITASLPPELLATPGSCTANTGACAIINPSTLTWTGTLGQNQSVTITYQTQLADGVPTGTQICVKSDVSFNGATPSTLTACATVNCAEVGPGLAPDAKSEVSDQKAGSVLIYNIYTSNAASPLSQNTRVNLTNIDPSRSAFVHLFFVDGSNCSVADSVICLTPNQTTSFLTSDIDPGVTGYIVAVAVDSRGCPINFNNLIGDAYVKFSTGHSANLGAEAVSAIAGGLALCDQNSVTARLNFDGVSYNRLPRALALDNILSLADGNNTLLVLNRIGGDLTSGAATLTNIFGVFYDDTEMGASFTFTPGVCQFRSSITNTFPRITSRFAQFVPSGRSGWLKLFPTSDQAILGAAINFNPNNEDAAGAFNQGHNLHKLTLTSSAVYTIPVFPPSC